MTFKKTKRLNNFKTMKIQLKKLKNLLNIEKVIILDKK
jgi:hypothetical protein